MGKRNKPTKKYNPDILKPYRPKKKKKSKQNLKQWFWKPESGLKFSKVIHPQRTAEKKRGGGQNSILVQKLDQST